MAIRKLEKLFWLYNKIKSSQKGLKLDELQELWITECVDDGNPLPTSSFRKYKNNLESLFDVNITCDACDAYAYKINKEDPETTSPAKEWLAQLLNVELNWRNVKGISDRVLLDNAPLGGQYIDDITNAISTSKRLHIAYKSFFEKETKQLTVSPYWLKMYNQRWYLVAHSEVDDTIYPYALDRIRSLEITENSFDYPQDLSASNYFNDSVGITVDMEYDIETIDFKVYGTQRNYIETLPIHHSQKRIEENPDYSIYSMVVRPSYELFEKLIAQQYHLEVLSPQWIREEMAAIITDMTNRYKA